jgi:very-short-patch-repair endonuclease/DNA polymerase III delta prime subunit
MVELNKTEVFNTKLAAWKNKLIDLSRHNRLLNFRPTKASTIKITDEIPSEVFNSLVIQNKSFYFLPREEDDLWTQEKSVEDLEVEFHPYASEELDNKHTDLNLQTALSQRRLQKNLKTIHFRSNQLMEEQGYNILYLSLGMLNWFEADHSEVINKSPLIMVPVELRQRSITSQFKLYHSGDDPFLNPALQYKLEYEAGLKLPDLPLEKDEFDPKKYLLQVKELVGNSVRWSVTNDIYLGLFSFAKFVMFKELDKYSDIYRDNEIIQALAGIFDREHDVDDFITAEELDSKRSPLEIFQVLDADSSQQEAIEAVKSGRSIIIQGPPGTGKSQTITNIISEVLGNQKNVLFVSEKMAALDVVYRRLQQVGLGSHCLEIHSRKANKRHVLEQLREAYDTEHPGDAVVGDKLEQLTNSKNDLNKYSLALHTSLEPFGKSPFWFLGQLNILKNVEIIDIDIPALGSLTLEKYQSILTTLDTLKERIKSIGQPIDHPFWGCSLANINQFELQTVAIELNNILGQMTKSIRLLEEFSNRLDVRINTIKAALSYCTLLEILAEEHTIPESLGKIERAEWYYEQIAPVLEQIDALRQAEKRIVEKFPVSGLSYSEQQAVFHSLTDVEDVKGYLDGITGVLDAIAEYQRVHRQNLTRYDAEILGENIGKELHDLKAKYRTFLRIFKPKYYATRKIFKRHLRAKTRLKYKALLSDAQDILLDSELKARITAVSQSIKQPLGPVWKYQDTDLTNLLDFIKASLDLRTTKKSIYAVPKNTYDPLGRIWKFHETDTLLVRSMLNWLVKYQKSRSDTKDDQVLLAYILDSKTVPQDLIKLKTSVRSQVESLITQLENIGRALAVIYHIVFPVGFHNTSLEQLLSIARRWKDNLDRLVDWTRYQRSYNECAAIGLKARLDALIEQRVTSENLVTKFKKSILYFLFQHATEHSPVLKNFEALTQEQLVKKFQRLDQFQFELAKIRVAKRLFEGKPDTNWEGSKNSELGYLQKQFRLKRGHHSIRKIFAHVPHVVQKLCPCFMMSPLSLSQFVDPGVMKFDVVVFDEASQMAPVDSLGAIVRGSQLVVVGDTKQLPPTTFFDRVVQSTEEENDEDMSTPDLESILDECLTVGIPQFTLKWHYRSRHESLIHFSNQSFYRNKLNTFASANTATQDFGVSLVHVKDAEYDRGGSGKNLREARHVAHAVMDQFKKGPNKSLGIGTFSQAQQVAVLDQLELLRRQDPSTEAFFSSDVEEPFFVKNLETIQGDERDVIFISVGYGRDSTGKITMNFGPINKPGGERRLNVLVTRARERVVVFTSILGDDFDLSKTQSVGVSKLKEYLDYAKSHGDRTVLGATPELWNEFDESNIFERSVYEQLVDRGIKVIPQVGYGGYKIDFGILDPDNPSRFILGVECDGARYHSCATARDRDRLRQQVLENLGWRFHRIWSTDWFLNPAREMSRLLNSIEEAKHSSGSAGVKRSSNEKLTIKRIKREEGNDNSGYEIVPYKVYTVKRLGSQADFYTSSNTPGSRRKIEELVAKIVEKEGPIHTRELSLRVIQHFDMGRVGPKITKILGEFISLLHKQGKIQLRGAFVYPLNFSSNLIRNRSDEMAPSNVDYIPPEEIRNAVMLVIRKETSINRQELIPKAARIFGFQHTGKKISNRIKNQVSKLLKEKRIVQSEYGLRHSQSEP